MERRKVLIVDDHAVNRKYLREVLEKDYVILEAENGRDALAVLMQDYESISGVLLDTVMPIMDGIAVLQTMRKDERLLSIPVIVSAEREDSNIEAVALAYGANDFIIAPFKPEIIRHRLANTIKLRETASILRQMQRDKLTGLYNRETFFERAAEKIRFHEPGYYFMAAFDIDNFKLINNQYGSEEGDRILKLIASNTRKRVDALSGIVCRISADNFAAMYPAKYGEIDFITDSDFQDLSKNEAQKLSAFSIGYYLISDKNIPLNSIYDRAYLAKRTVKNRYDVHKALYDQSMSDKIEHEQNIRIEMIGALERHEFEAWYQPQYNHANGALIGAEALARWRHPLKGLIPPSGFIPLFERNGFIYELDKFIWEEACTFQRERLDEGNEALPISVNISRLDLLHDDLVSVIFELVNRYKLPPELINLEITESAFTQSSERVISVVRQLLEHGFSVEIDDFGSGFSSLNTLKDVPANVLKLDMRFLEKENGLRGGNILESIVRMAKWLDMSVIAEGVETLEQAEFLKSIGCKYVQGYLYARPMPEEEFAEMYRNYKKENRLSRLEEVENLDTNTFWDPLSMETLIFNSYIGGACILEYSQGRIEILRYNRKFAEEILGPDSDTGMIHQLDITKYMNEEHYAIFIKCIHGAISTRKECDCVVQLCDLPVRPGVVWIRSVVRMIARAEERYLIYGTVSDITETQMARQRELDSAEQLRLLMSDMPGGLVRMRIKKDGETSPIFVNERFCQLVGLTNEEIIQRYMDNPMWDVHPDDYEIAQESHSRMLASGSTCRAKYRLLRGNGEYIRLSISGRASYNADGYTYINVFYTDEREADRRDELYKELLDNLPCGAALYTFDGKNAKIMHLNRQFRRMLWREDEWQSDISLLTLLHPDDSSILEKKLAQIQLQDTTIAQTALDLRVRNSQGDYAGFHTQIRAVKRFDESWTIYMTLTPVSEDEVSLQLLTNSIPGGIASYELSEQGLRILYFSDGYYSNTGYTREEYRAISSKNAIGMVFEEEIEGIREEFAKVLKGQDELSYEYRIHCKDGSYTWTRLNAIVSLRYDGKALVNVIKIDINEAKRKDERLRIHNEEMKLAMAQMGKMICEYDPVNRVLHLPEVLAAQLVLPTLSDNMPERFIRQVEKQNRESARILSRFFNAIHKGESSGVAEFYSTYIGNDLHWQRWTFYTIFDVDMKPAKVIIAAEDQTEEHEKELHWLENERLLKEKAEHDAMTGLFNRATMEELINGRLNASDGSQCALLVCDLDNLKSINDILGHDHGDIAIRSMGKLLTNHFRKDDLVGRTGGDEFVIFLNNCGDQEWLTKSMSRLMQEKAQIRIGNDKDLPLNCSFGIAFVEHGANSYDELFTRADRALYQVKRNGKNDFAFYVPEMEESFFAYTGHSDAFDKNGIMSMSSREAELMIQDLKQIFDVVRIVSPLELCVQSIGQKGKAGARHENCYAILGKTSRCENCTSLRVLNTKERLTKYEYCNKHLYHIMSRYVEVNGSPFVMEAVSDVTSQLHENSAELERILGTIKHSITE